MHYAVRFFGLPIKRTTEWNVNLVAVFFSFRTIPMHYHIMEAGKWLRYPTKPTSSTGNDTESVCKCLKLMIAYLRFHSEMPCIFAIIERGCVVAVAEPI